MINKDVQLYLGVLLTSDYPTLAQSFTPGVVACLWHLSPPWSSTPFWYVSMAPAGRGCKHTDACVIQAVRCTWRGPRPRPVLQCQDTIGG